jgi:hypothetical protein
MEGEGERREEGLGREGWVGGGARPLSFYLTEGGEGLAAQLIDDSAAGFLRLLLSDSLTGSML